MLRRFYYNKQWKQMNKPAIQLKVEEATQSLKHNIKFTNKSVSLSSSEELQKSNLLQLRTGMAILSDGARSIHHPTVHHPTFHHLTFHHLIFHHLAYFWTVHHPSQILYIIRLFTIQVKFLGKCNFK